MQVMVGLRRRFLTFCDFALVSNASSPSRNPYHIATRWIVPSPLIDAREIVCFPWRNASISSSDILIWSRCLTPFPICPAAPPSVVVGSLTLTPSPLGVRCSPGYPARSRSRHPPGERLDDAGGALAALDLDGDEHRGLDATLDVGDLLHLGAGADALADEHRRDEPHLVDAVVDRHGEPLVPGDLGQEEAGQRQGEVPVGDGAAERPLLGPLDVDVDPLVVAGRLRERVHPLLGDLEPLAEAEVLAHRGPDALGAVEHPYLSHSYPPGSPGPCPPRRRCGRSVPCTSGGRRSRRRPARSAAPPTPPCRRPARPW